MKNKNVYVSDVTFMHISSILFIEMNFWKRDYYDFECMYVCVPVTFLCNFSSLFATNFLLPNFCKKKKYCMERHVRLKPFKKTQNACAYFLLYYRSVK